ncbi:hypothetical protein [Deinococcus planocerae]|uniref:hypothetical protein n=1 Tax=Deinococcus planocerae TaxID=1737569 RepID=UPI000C7F4CBE|nr:hypothetical protein [Deinococcus planocerae]
MRLRGTHRLLKAIPPEWPTLHVTGSLVGRMLLLEEFQPYPLLPRRPGEARRWVDEWGLAEGLEPFPGLTTRVIGRHDRLRRAPFGRCYLNGRPFKGMDFEALLRGGYLRQR